MRDGSDDRGHVIFLPTQQHFLLEMASATEFGLIGIRKFSRSK